MHTLRYDIFIDIDYPSLFLWWLYIVIILLCTWYDSLCVDKLVYIG